MSNVAWISTNAAGQYSATGLPSGTYYAATWNSAGYINEVYNNIRCVGYCSDFAAATPITVTAGATTAGRNFDLDLGGGISGVVTRADTSAALADVSVFALWRSPQGDVQSMGSGFSDADGKYAIGGLPTGTYYLYTQNDAGFINEVFDNLQCLGFCEYTALFEKGTPVAVAEGSTATSRNFALDVGGGFSGAITSSAGGAIADAVVNVYTRGPFGGSVYVTSVYSDSSGMYEAGGLLSGAYYAYTDATGHQNAIYNGVSCLRNCSSATAVSAGHPITVSVGQSRTGIDFLLNKGGSIAGTVRHAVTAAALDDANVHAYRDVGDGYLNFAGSAQTSATGAYSVTGLPSGLYYVFATSSDFQDQVYPGINCVRLCQADFVQAHGTQVFVANGSVSGGRDFSLHPVTGRIAGTIINSANSAPAPEVNVYVYARSGSGYVYVGSGYTSQTGFYEITELPTGTYYAATNSYGAFVDEIFADIPCFTACDFGVGPVLAGAPIAVSTGTTTLNFALQPRPAVQLPGQPQGLLVRIAAGSVALNWSEPYEFGPPTDYLLEIGLAPGTTLLSIPVAGRAYTANGVPAGRYFVRVRGRNAAGVGPPSSEAEITVNPDGSGAPDPPSELLVFHDGNSLEMNWAASTNGGVTTGYVLEIGTASGLSDIATIAVGPRSVYTYSGPIPPGAYFIRVRARNAASVGLASPEVMLVSGSGPAPPNPPGQIGYAVDAARNVVIGWLPPRGPVLGYRLEVGTGWDRADLGVFSIAGPVSSLALSAVPPGVYFVRLRSVNAQGVGVASFDIAVVVP